MIKSINALTLFSVFFLTIQISFAQKDPEFLKYMNDTWVDSTLQNMSTDQKIGQLFIVQAYSKENSTIDKPLNEIKQFQAGGVIFMQGTAKKQATFTNQLQKNSKIPLLISMDAEWGPSFRLADSPRYPTQMALGAIQEDSLIYKMGTEIAHQLKRIGVHINFAPVSDVNNNPLNPVINFRSFGEDPNKVAHKAWLYAKGMQDEGILAVAKHFPGHGNTSTDSHLGLPVNNQSIEELNNVELYPFRQLINDGIGGIMVAHIQVPALEPNENIPSSLSKNIIQGQLIEKDHFKGLIVTDAMNMKGVTDKFPSGEAVVRAIIAGNDMVEIVPDINSAVNALKKAIKQKRISIDELNHKCRKILALKKWMNLDHFEPISTKNINKDINLSQYSLTRRLLHEESLTLLRNKNNIIPLQRLDTLRIAAIVLGTNNTSEFQHMAANYMNVSFFNLRKNATSEEVNQLIKRLKDFNLLLCDIEDLNLYPKSQYGTDSSINEFIGKTAFKKKRIFVLEGNPYSLRYLSGIERSDALLITYQENKITKELAAQAIFGAIDINGKLPVNINSSFRLGDGINIYKIDRLIYTIPEDAGISSDYLYHRVDSIIKDCIEKKACPGCQVLMAKDGKVILNKCYGYHTYDNKIPVKSDDLYDWASLTKITGPLPALIRLYDEGKYKLDIPFSKYWPNFLESNKKRITSREILTHQARLKSGIFFWKEALLPDGTLDSTIFSTKPTKDFSVRVSSHLYMNRKNISDMMNLIKDSELLKHAKYKYSGMAFYIYPFIIENITGQDYQSYLKETFYAPLGASTVTYNPYLYFPLSRIVPSEKDDFFRHELLHGFVSDEAAAMLGGVSGNAGLFGSANDLSKIMEMYLQNGNYGGINFMSKKSLAEFTRVQYKKNKNRRGLGFDKPSLDNDKNKPDECYPAVSTSPESYGHTGFTGGLTWVDPKEKILFVFLSNRVYPTRENHKLVEMNVRSKLLQTIYDSIGKNSTY
ncbi:MAG: serine hydrolase [Prolixibacteraceae bacterium]|nr:serine hydrolase [Prolixibacteraceae bacterium]